MSKQMTLVEADKLAELKADSSELKKIKRKHKALFKAMYEGE